MGAIATSVVSPSINEGIVSLEIRRRFSGVCKALCLGLIITAAQVLCASLISGQPNLARAYATLYAWDGGWYGRGSRLVVYYALSSCPD